LGGVIRIEGATSSKYDVSERPPMAKALVLKNIFIDNHHMIRPDTY
jgi:hypothetical protein